MFCTPGSFQYYGKVKKKKKRTVKQKHGEHKHELAQSSHH